MKLGVFVTDASGAVSHLGAIEADRFERSGPTTAELGPNGRMQLMALLGQNARARMFDLIIGAETLRGCVIGKIGGASSGGGGCVIEFQQMTT